LTQEDLPDLPLLGGGAPGYPHRPDVGASSVCAVRRLRRRDATWGAVPGHMRKAADVGGTLMRYRLAALLAAGAIVLAACNAGTPSTAPESWGSTASNPPATQAPPPSVASSGEQLFNTS